MTNRQDLIAIDIETTGLTWASTMLTFSMAKFGADGVPVAEAVNVGYRQAGNLFGIAGVALDARDISIEPVSIPEARRRFVGFCKGRSVLVFHNGAFDIPFLVRSSIITEAELARWSVFDTMIFARATGPADRVGLGYLCEKAGIGSPEWRDMKSRRGTLAKEPWPDVEKYSLDDALNTLRLGAGMFATAQDMYGDISDMSRLLHEESEWVKLVAMMRYTGIQIDMERLDRVEAQRLEEFEGLKAILKMVGIRGPSDAVGIIAWVKKHNLLESLGTTLKGAPSTDAESMRNLAEVAARMEGNKDKSEIVQVAEAISGGRSLETALSTWLTGLRPHIDSAGRIHPGFTPSGARTHRLSCSHPNVQNFPKEYRCYKARDGWGLWSSDWSQAELRISAMLAGEVGLAKIFAAGVDPHMAAAKALYSASEAGDWAWERHLAKRGVFGSIYGAGVRAIMRATGCTETKGKELLAGIKRLYPGIAAASLQAEGVWMTRGYLLLMGGKRLYASDQDKLRAYKAFNNVVQGSVAEIVKKAMIAIRDTLPVLLTSQVHDSIEKEVELTDRTSLPAVKRIMEGVIPSKYMQRVSPPIAMAVDTERLDGKKEAA